MFEKAERKKAKLRLALCGPSGSGKTYSALRMASGLGGRTAVIDTENRSASLYADEFDFDVLNLAAPFTPSRYVQAIKEAEKAGYDNIVIDSLSHAWSSEGGVLSSVDRLNGTSANSGWRKMGPEQNRFMDALVQSLSNILATMRVKTEYSYEKDETTGKVIPKKIGLAPVQKNDLEYEFTVVFDLSQSDKLATVSKNRTKLFRDGIPFLITEDTGRQIKDWLNEGKDELAQQIADICSCVTMDELKATFERSYYTDPRIVAAKDTMKEKLTNQADRP